MKKNYQTTESGFQNVKVVETTKKHQEPHKNNKEITISRGKYDTITLFEITENELDVIEKGSPTNVYLNFSIFLLSMATTFLVTLKTTNLEYNSFEFIVFTIISVVGFIVGGFLFILWFRNKNSMTKLCQKIRQRLRTDPDGAVF